MAVADRIKHVVVLMMENRSFDHLFGYLDLPNIDGLATGDYWCSPIKPGDPPVRPRPTTGVDDDYITCPDPGHGMEDVTQQVFDLDKDDPRQVVNSVPRDPHAPATMRGFVRNFATQKSDGCTVNWRPEDIMRCFRPEHLPVMTALAKSYVLIDRWFCSIPGATWPNRFWAHACTAMGHGAMEDSYIKQCMIDSPFTARTLFNAVESAFDPTGPAPWRVYFHQTPHCSTLTSIADRLNDPDYFRPFDELEQFDWASGAPMLGFAGDVAAGDLPFYTFIEPQFDAYAPLRNVVTDNSMHPPADVRAGEVLVARVYNALRANEALWNETLLLVTYDEHGGFYDHVVPPRVPSLPPDAPASKLDAAGNPVFLYDRCGPRVPALVISPWVQKGVIDHGPGTGAKPNPSIHYEHSSLARTIREILGIAEPLTGRDNVATSFAHLVRDVKRDASDCPEKLGAEWGVE